MTWAPLLLADPSPGLRWLVLRELLGRSDEDEEVLELQSLRHSDRLVRDLVELQDDDGSWRGDGGSGESWHRIQATAHALVRMAYLGFGPEHKAVQSGAEYLFGWQQKDGSWPLPRIKSEREFRQAYSMIPLQTGLPLRALALAGFATHPRAEKGYEWLVKTRLDDGAWPSGVKGGKVVFPAGYRRLAHSRFGCRTNTSFAVSALAHHPGRRHGQIARRGLDLLLVQETTSAASMGYEVARSIGLEPASGFFTYFARHDVAFVLDLCWRVGASLEDARVEDLVAFARGQQGAYGLWSYAPKPEASRWLSFDLLRSLSRIDSTGDWVSLEPRTPFHAYPKHPRRY
jgi:hypothetical protein